MKRIESKLDRLYQMEQILLAHPEGLSRAELARRLGTHRSTIGRYLTDTKDIFPIWEEDGLLGIDRDSYVNNVKLNIHEIMVLHLSARLFSCRTDKFNPHACSAMRKLGHCLRSYSKTISEYILRTAENIDKQAGKRDNEFIAILEKLTRAWSDGLWTRLSYHSRQKNEIHEYDFAPYFVQPYAAGFSLYVIGFCRQKKRIITLKVERIADVCTTTEKFHTPEEFDPEILFEDAWGIWYSDGEPVEVVLEFSPRVSARVAETVWHKSQSVEKLARGGLLWKARIAEPLELFPWIRGWGSDVRIVKPEELRLRHREDLEAAIENYGKK